MIDLVQFRNMAACVPFIEPDAGARETTDAMMAAATEIEQLRNERDALLAIIDKTPWVVEHIASGMAVAAFAHRDVACGYMDRAEQIGHWRFSELRLVDCRPRKVSQ